MRSRTPAMLFALTALAVFLFTAIGVVAQSTPSRSLLALSKRDHTLAIVDPTTLKVIARAPVGPDPHEVIASSDGKTAYVSIYGGGRYHALSVIDLVAQKALPDIDTGAFEWSTRACVCRRKGLVHRRRREGRRQLRSCVREDRLDYGHRPESDAYALRHRGREADLHDERELRDGQRSGKVTLPPMGPPPGMRPQGSAPPPGGISRAQIGIRR